METINVKDLPAAVAHAIEAMVATIRNQIPPFQQKPKEPVRLPVWPGTVRGSLSRKEIYEDVA